MYPNDRRIFTILQDRVQEQWILNIGKELNKFVDSTNGIWLSINEHIHPK